MKKSDMLECMINYYCDGNKSRFAEKLGIKPQTINSWIVRNTFDAELVYANCEGISSDWLLSGEGEMLREQHSVDKSTSDKELIELCKLLVANYQQRDLVMNKLMSRVKHL